MEFGWGEVTEISVNDKNIVPYKLICIKKIAVLFL